VNLKLFTVWFDDYLGEFPKKRISHHELQDIYNYFSKLEWKWKADFPVDWTPPLPPALLALWPSESSKFTTLIKNSFSLKIDNTHTILQYK